MPVVMFPSSRTSVLGTWRVVLVKGTRERLYEIRQAGESGAMQTWVRFDRRPHRAKLTRSVLELAQIRGEFEREITALLEDGWVVQPRKSLKGE